MRCQSIFAENFRSFKVLEEMRLGPMATIVGQNDVGKSNILRALQIFFESKPKIDSEDVYDGPNSEGDVVIEVSFTSLPENIELENGIETTFQAEMLVDSDDYLRIRKTYPRDNVTKYKIELIVHDFQDPRFQGLATTNEQELNTRCATEGIPVTTAGRGVTNKSKREALRASHIFLSRFRY